MNLMAYIAGQGLREYAALRQHFVTAPFYMKMVDVGTSELFSMHYSARTPKGVRAVHRDVIEECRGIILDQTTLQIVCYPFSRFFNYDEDGAACIDWSSPQLRVQLKEDGSIFKLYNYKGEWRVATNNLPDASASQAMNPTTLQSTGKSYRDLFYEAERQTPISWNRLHPRCTYIFEVLHPEHPIVLDPPSQPRLIHLGTRSNDPPFLEISCDIGVPKPLEFPEIRSLEECIAASKRLVERDPETGALLAITGEGFVVVDMSVNPHRRVKIKNPHYVRKANELVELGAFGDKTSERRRDRHFLDLLLKGERAEVEVYVPETRPVFALLEQRFRRLFERFLIELHRVSQEAAAVNNKSVDDLSKREFLSAVDGFQTVFGQSGRDRLRGMYDLRLDEDTRGIEENLRKAQVPRLHELMQVCDLDDRLLNTVTAAKDLAHRIERVDEAVETRRPAGT
eukprot:TRINITY_DN12338_c0_g1_i1.p1 TRINITY_DN12338_c0_g1~~TRINITY_DN12338_c0_g1_i1.p1  ORF type:complete len:463 (-),score=65.64 TRINITY_DN12338_c0_g1_i1:8-1369(-)